MRACGVIAVAIGLVCCAVTSIAADGSGQRVLAPGVLIVISPSQEPVETFSGPRPLVEIARGLPDLDWTPHYTPKSETLLEKSRTVVFRRPIWNLEFAFKPMRLIEADVLQPSGKLQRKLIWYIVYRVTNRGYALRPKGTEDRWGHTLFQTEDVNYQTRRFFPQLVLASHEYNKEYLDRPTLLTAQRMIQQRESPGLKLYNSVEITKVPIPLSDDRTEQSVWGVAMWEDVDPRIDFFSIYVDGLTNAFRFEDQPDAYNPGDPPGTGRTYTHKNLQLNFWRPGDTVREHEREIRFGVPADSSPARQQELLEKYGLNRRLDYLWVYR